MRSPGEVRQRRTQHQKKRHTIYDVAHHAGVSIATVSRFLKHIEPISPETKKRVELSIAKLNYRPSALASSLASRHKQSIGFIISQGPRAYSSLFLSEILAGIATAAAQNGWSVHISMLDSSQKHTHLLERHVDLVDGSLVLDQSLDDASVQQAIKKGHRVVVMNRRHPSLPFVGIDNFGGALLAVRHILGLGHRRIACLGGSSLIGRERLEGFTTALKKAGVKPVAVVDCEFEREHAEAAAQRLLAGKNPPTAFIVASDWMAVGVLAAATTLGRRVPEDVSVIGFDDAIISEVTAPALTTVRQPLEEMGRTAFELFLKIVADTKKVPQQQFLSTELVIRQSTAAIK